MQVNCNVFKFSESQASLHRWGAANRVSFDPAKEGFVVIRRQKAIGEDFKLLGVSFDAQLLMHKGVRKIAIEAGWRVKAILRARSYFTTPELVRLYKANVLSYIESGVAGYFHACDSTLASLDRIQNRFLQLVGLSAEEALLNFRLAPLCMRRSIGILGFLHRVTLGYVSGQISDLFPRATRSSVQDVVSARVRGVRSATTSNWSTELQLDPRNNSRGAYLAWCNATMLCHRASLTRHVLAYSRGVSNLV